MLFLQLCQRTHLVLGELDELLAGEPGVDGHDHDVVAEVQHLFHGGQAGVRVDGNAGCGAAALDVRQRLDHIALTLGVDVHDVGTGIQEPVHLLAGVLDHQVHVHRLFGVLADGLEVHQTHGDVGHKGAVHDVTVEDVHTGFVQRLDLLGQAAVVRAHHTGAEQLFHFADPFLSSR